nr:uncharacterized protein CTRU02_00210 [Colletotrichum truncatum]KAF6801461.1 hypothetical protein CTRU02_00210 [Colletotrichum truncatum]
MMSISRCCMEMGQIALANLLEEFESTGAIRSTQGSDNNGFDDLGRTSIIYAVIAIRPPYGVSIRIRPAIGRLQHGSWPCWCPALLPHRRIHVALSSLLSPPLRPPLQQRRILTSLMRKRVANNQSHMMNCGYLRVGEGHAQVSHGWQASRRQEKRQ